MNNEMQQRISSSLFHEIKPICVSLLNESSVEPAKFNTNTPQIIELIQQLNQTLTTHKSNSIGIYSLSANLGDYIFFPVSNLLKQPTLNDKVIENVLDILDFLIINVWVPNDKFNQQLIDQLLPVILYLIKGGNDKRDITFSAKELVFIQSSNDIINTLVKTVDKQFFLSDDTKNLSMLGDIFEILIEILKTSQDTSIEGIQIITKTLGSFRILATSISPYQLSRIFPGLISSLINYGIRKKPKFEITCQIIDLLRILIVTVFKDSELSVKYNEPEMSMDGMHELWEKTQNNEITQTSNVTISFTIDSGDFRNDKWLRATSKQLKISLNAFFKHLFSNKIIKQQVFDSLLFFIKDILKNCYGSLFNELFALNIDVLSLLCFSKFYPDTGKLSVDLQLEILDDIFVYLGAGFEQFYESSIGLKSLGLKLQDLITNKLSSIMSSTSDDRILQFFISLKVHFWLLSKHSDNVNMNDLIYQQLNFLQKSLVEMTMVKPKKNDNSEFLRQYQGENVFEADQEGSDNKLDNIQLPPYVNANNLTKINNRQPSSKTELSSDLLILSQQWTLSQTIESTETRYFDKSFSNQVEVEISEFIMFLKQFKCDKVNILENLLSVGNDKLQKSISLWICNQFFKQEEREIDMDINEFIDFGDDDTTSSNTNPNNDEIEEIAYLLGNESQEIIETIQPELDSLTLITNNTAEFIKNEINQQSYSIAIDTIGNLSSTLSKDEFQENFLINYLFPIFESLTFNSNPKIQTHAKNTILKISKNYYNDSIKNLILDNSNYLIDSLSLKLSLPDSLTPSLSGILLIILKISGPQLIKNNQLSDIITQMFILIDSYHGYSILVEGFFIVFNELIHQIKITFMKSQDVNLIEHYDSLYKPWGLQNLKQFKDLLDDSKKLVEPFEGYENDKEYFRKPDTPFADIDSDDEDDQELPEEQEMDKEEQEVWKSIIPKDIYFQAQKIFIYGLRMLSHPSNSLKIRVLKCLIDVYPILTTNYSLLLPIIASNWSDILLLLPNNDVDYNDEVSVSTLEFLVVMLETDKFHNDIFLSKRFIESFQIIEKAINLPLDSSLTKNVSKTIIKFKSQANVKLLSNLSKYLITGLNNYERIIPDTTAIKLMKVVMVIGLPNIKLGKQARNILWVLQRQQ